MRYHYTCHDCETKFTAQLPMDEHKTPQPCPTCGELIEKDFRPTTNFILKGDGWAGKNNRIANQMREKNKKLDARQNEMKRDAPVASLAPNVDGERTSTWSEAQKLAKSKGKDTSSYDTLVAKEKASK
jgi:putative FmdB family regulatory protein